MVWKALTAEHPCPMKSRCFAALDIFPILPCAQTTKFLSACPNNTRPFTLQKESSCMPYIHRENLCGHHHPDPFAGLNVSLHFQLPFSSSQTHQFVSCCLDKVLFSGTSTPQAGSQWSCPTPHVILHLHLKLTRLFHSQRRCFTPLPPTNSTEMSSSSDNSESRHDRSTAF